MDHSPFLIVGCGRSGTSLLRSLLNRHQDIAIPLESLFIVDYLRAASHLDLETLKGILVREPEILEWGIAPSIHDLTDCDSIGGAIARLHEIYAGKVGKSTWGQKTPRFVRHLPLLKEHFPSMRVVHIIRDPRAVVSSLMNSDVHRSDPYHGAQRWRLDVSYGLSFGASNPEEVFQVKYEDLVNRPNELLDQIVGFLGLEPAWESQPRPLKEADEYSAFYDNIHANLDRPPSTQFVDKWRNELSAHDVEIVEAVCLDRMIELGYRPEHERPNPGKGRFRRARMLRLIRIPMQAARYLRYRRTYLFHLFWRKWRLGLLKEFLWEINY